MKRAEKKNTGIYNIFGALIVLALVGLTIVVINVIKNPIDPRFLSHVSNRILAGVKTQHDETRIALVEF